MKNSVIYAVAIGLAIGTATVASFLYTEKTTNYVVQSLENTRISLDKGEHTDELSKLVDSWEEKKKYLMFIINHRDVENVSVSLIKAKQRAEGGEFQEAIKEIEIAIFLVKELTEKERLVIENVL